MLKFIDDFFDILRTKAQKERKYKKKVIFDNDSRTPEERIKNFSKKVPDLKNKIYLDIMEIIEKEKKKAKEINELLTYESYIKYIPQNNNSFFLNKENQEYNFNNNAPKILDELVDKTGNFFSEIVDSLKSKNESENEINNIINMNDEDRKKIRSENFEEIKPPKKYEMKKGTGEFRTIFFGFVLPPIFFIFFLYRQFLTINLNLEKYESVTSFDSGILDKIRTVDDFKKFDDETLKDLALRVYKFAIFGYKNRKDNKIIFNEPFLGWKIIGDNLIGEDNSFTILKDPKYKRLIFTFPGTKSGFQLLEEVLGSGLKNFDENNKDILISKYFGERISEILEYIYTPEIIELIKNNYKVIATGHSLGGAIAEAFIYFSLIKNRINRNNSPMALTFNQPRVGNALFKEFLDNNSINVRFTYGKDIVSRIPFCNFGLFDMIKFIFNKRNIYNEYAHTKIEYNIYDEDANFISGIVNNIIFEIIALIISLILCIIYYYKIYCFINEEFWDAKRFIIFNHYLGYRRIIDYENYILKLVNALRILALFLLAYLLFYIVPLYYKYKAYKFSIVFITIIIIILILLFYISICCLLFFYEIFIFLINIILCFLNCFITEKTTYRLKDKKKFKQSSLKEKFTILLSCCYVGGSALSSSTVNKRIFSHSKSGQRSGKEKIDLIEDEINQSANKTGIINNPKELLLKMMKEHEKEKLNMSN